MDIYPDTDSLKDLKANLNEDDVNNDHDLVMKYHKKKTYLKS